MNHCSNQHSWFLEARKGRDNPYHDYFIWRDGDSDTYPNETRSVFEGPAWTYAPEVDRWYFHQFAPAQPDLNWDNPRMRNDLYRFIRFWVDKGVEGFRLDVIALRKELDVIRTGSFTLLDAEDKNVFAYTRDFDNQHLLVVYNFTGEQLDYEVPEEYFDFQLL